MLRLQQSIVIVLLITLSACSQKPIETNVTATFTPYVGGAETAIAVLAAETQTALAASPTPNSLPTISFSTPSSTPLITLTPTTTPTPVVLPSDFSPVLYGNKYDADTFFILLGGVQGGRWLPADQAATQITGASLYDVYTFAKGMYQVYGYAPHSGFPISQGYFLNTDATLGEFGMVGVAHGWQVTQRVVEELPSENELYRQVVIDWLSQAGIADPQIGTIQIHRVDLEGDGSDEIFITDTRVEGQHGIKTGDHSIILMRKVIGNEVVNMPILVDLYASLKQPYPFPCTYSIGNFIDLNQDGILEVVVEFVRWEGFGGVVYQVNGQNVNEVLGATCITP